MDLRENNLQSHHIQKDFWDSLQLEFLNSNQELTREDFIYFIEKNYIYSAFFRGTTYKEILSFKKLFGMEDNAYLILLELLPENKTNLLDSDFNDFEFYLFLKNTLGQDTVNAIGPVISNRIVILISVEAGQPESLILNNSIALTQKLITAIRQEYSLSVYAGIGNVYPLHSIYTSFLDALSCIHHCQSDQVLHVSKLEDLEQDYHYDYMEAEKHMIDAIRLRKPNAYDYFFLMMNYIKPMNDEVKRNKVIEALIMAAHAAQIDGQNKADYFNYTSQIPTIMELSGNELIEWALQKFMYITGYVKPQASIDYSNKIVQTTKDYLEAHYSEEISLEDIAEVVNISPQYFSKLIKKNTGFNFIDWLSMLRVKKAKELLTNSSYTVKEVCFMVGYKDPNYFSRIFKKRIGITPSEFIKNRTYVNSKN